MKIIGWNSFPDGCTAEVNFHAAPLWMRLTAHVIFVERFVYPRAVKMGLGILWIENDSLIESELLIRNGWLIRTRASKTDLEKFLEGSLAFLSANPKKTYRRPFAISKWGRKRALEKYIHKCNGTLLSYEQRILPQID